MNTKIIKKKAAKMRSKKCKIQKSNLTITQGAVYLDCSANNAFRYPVKSLFFRHLIALCDLNGEQIRYIPLVQEAVENLHTVIKEHLKYHSRPIVWTSWKLKNKKLYISKKRKSLYTV